MKPAYVLYVVGLIFTLLFAANCDCDKKDPDPAQHTVTTIPCMMSTIYMPGTPAYDISGPNGIKFHFPGTPGYFVTFPCPDTKSSPVWPKSQQPIYTPAATKSSARPFSSRAFGAGLAAYLPTVLLDLPFSPLRSASDTPPTGCDPSQPDVIQVDHDNAAVARIATCLFQAKTTIRVVSRPLQIEITPDGQTALVTSFDNAVNFIDLNSNQVTFTLQTGSSINPNGIAVSPDGKTAYITSFVPNGAVVAKIDLASRSIVATLPVDPYPQNLFLSPDGSQLFVTFPYENEVGIIDTFTFTMAYSFSIPAPRGIAFSRTGTAYIAAAGNPDNAILGSVMKFDTNSFQLGPTYQVGLGPNDIAVLYGDQYVVTVNYEGQSISTIDTVSGSVGTTPLGTRAAGLSILH